MKKNGFTLIELIGAFVILSIIAIVVFPTVVNMLNRANNKVKDSVKLVMLSAAEEYVQDHLYDYPKLIGTEGFRTYGSDKIISYELLESTGYVSGTIGDKHCEVKDDKIIVTSNNVKYFFEYVDDTNNNGCK